jgi:1,4-alpha-glucan branching enzyme
MAKVTKAKKRGFTFKLRAVDANNVYLAGDFNDWSTDSHPMKKVRNGEWEKRMTLPTGKYEYKFYVDGAWKVDPNNDQVSKNTFGTYNSVLSLIA